VGRSATSRKNRFLKLEAFHFYLGAENRINKNQKKLCALAP
jgi:hypothetical protein